MIYRLRVILDNDTEDDIFRDIEINKKDALVEFHKSIITSFGFSNNEIASFYLSDNQWNQGEEISLFSFEDQDNKLMSDILINDVINNQNNKLIYVYDFLHMWTFLIELIEVAEDIKGIDYPNIIFSKGEIPEKAPEKKFESEKREIVDGEDPESYREDDNDFY
ncbi:MAG: hypothetical protein P8K70_04090 [Flavobacteriaceae bacterium]|nr:hypothetical protein [Flavobacteriaceae bacterium]